ncbi:hypothetical protein Bca4012_075875 [Brassica carinata]|uniref:Uncharacterized protein n=1 Tax=Brassica carinata TaxID=52824 RepID=A0A8X7QEL0_BRACI|nr:hypothetical protein Bca52824_073737 [Brassica carinata]
MRQEKLISDKWRGANMTNQETPLRNQTAVDPGEETTGAHLTAETRLRSLHDTAKQNKDHRRSRTIPPRPETGETLWRSQTCNHRKEQQNRKEPEGANRHQIDSLAHGGLAGSKKLKPGPSPNSHGRVRERWRSKNKTEMREKRSLRRRRKRSRAGRTSEQEQHTHWRERVRWVSLMREKGRMLRHYVMHG